MKIKTRELREQNAAAESTAQHEKKAHKSKKNKRVELKGDNDVNQNYRTKWNRKDHL